MSNDPITPKSLMSLWNRLTMPHSAVRNLEEKDRLKQILSGQVSVLEYRIIKSEW